jgi:hypothetical protein
MMVHPVCSFAIGDAARVLARRGNRHGANSKIDAGEKEAKHCWPIRLNTYVADNTPGMNGWTCH